MSKSKIQLQPGKVYHIWSHANGDENLFRNRENYNYFLEKYIYYIHPIADTFAYCLMPNHFHLMVRLKEETVVLKHLKKRQNETTSNGRADLAGVRNLSGLISKQFSNLFNSYTKSFNKSHNRKGSLFKRPFNRKSINSQTYYTHLIAYIHNNPVHHGFVDHPADWPFSSWHAYVLDKATNISKEEAQNWFNDDFDAIHAELNHKNYMPVLE
ncbi:MAG: hypothetical protein WD016_09740 [Balneolaceae bacterium]